MYAMEEYRSVQVQLHSLLISVQDS